MLPGLTEGRTVNYVLDRGDFPPGTDLVGKVAKAIPAIVTRAHETGRTDGRADLRLMPPEGFELPANMNTEVSGRVHSVMHSPRTWHFPERA